MMNITKMQKHIIVVISIILLFSGLASPVYADVDDQGPEGTAKNQATLCDPSVDPSCKDPALDCGTSGSGDCGIFDQYINPLIVFLSAAVGVAVTIGLIYGGIQYASAGSDPNAVSKARNTIKSSLVALVAFLFLLALLNWLVPGGISP